MREKASQPASYRGVCLVELNHFVRDACEGGLQGSAVSLCVFRGGSGWAVSAFSSCQKVEVSCKPYDAKGRVACCSVDVFAYEYVNAAEAVLRDAEVMDCP